MDSIFLEILNRSIAAGWVVVAIILVRLAMKKAPKNLICGLWGLVGFRLLFGGSFESVFSLIPSAQTIAPESVYDPSPVITSGIQAVDNAVNPIYSASLQTDGLTSANPLQIWLFIGRCVWLAGMAVMVVYALVSYGSLRRKVAESIQVQPGIFLCDRIDTPFILGIIKPGIYLPSCLDGGTAAHVIAHEKAHLRRKDHWWKPLAFIFLTVFWFNPILWVGYILLCRDIELACDEAVVKAMTVTEKKSYSTALLECSVHRVSIAACPLAFGEVGVKERVKTVLNYKKPAFWVVLISMIAAVVLAVGFLTDPVSNDPMICFETLVYVQKGAKSQFLPTDAEEVGVVAGIQESGTYPETELFGMNLDESYVGCTLYYHDQSLYLKDPDGYYHQFTLTTEPVFGTPFDLTSRITADLVDVCSVSTWGDQQIKWTLREEELDALIDILHSIDEDEISMGKLFDHSVSVVLYCPQEHAQSRWTTHLKYADGKVAILFDSGEVDSMYGRSSGTKYWTIENDRLNAWMEQYAARVDEYSSLDSYIVHHVEVSTEYGSFTVGIPQGWSYQQDYQSIRIWPDDVSEGYVCLGVLETELQPENKPIRSLTFSNGMTATQYGPVDDSLISCIIFEDISIPLTAHIFFEGWWPEYANQMYSILGTLTQPSNEPTAYTAEDFGLTLRAENVTSTGLTLVIEQSGVPVVDLMTGRPFHLEQLTEHGWTPVPLLDRSETIAWTTEGLMIHVGGSTALGHSWEHIYGSLEPGHYRIVKSFSAKFLDRQTLFVNPTYYDATCYAEFTIEAAS